MKTARKAYRYQDLGRLLRIGLLVLAVALQGYVTQLHHHDFAAATLAASMAGDTTSQTPISPVDGDGRDHHCFICHLSSLGATPVAPPTIAFTAMPIGMVVYGDEQDLLVARGAPAAYASRAPPSLIVPA